MRVEIRARSFTLSSALREHVEQRLDAATVNQREHVGDVTVHLSDDNGPRGGVDKLVHVTAIVLGKPLVVDERNADLRAAVDLAMHRLAESVRRTVDRKREFTAVEAGKS